MTNAVFGSSPFQECIYQYPYYAYWAWNTFACSSKSIQSSIQEREELFFNSISFSFLQSTQKRTWSSFWGTNRTAMAYLDTVDSITSASSCFMIKFFELTSSWLHSLESRFEQFRVLFLVNQVFWVFYISNVTVWYNFVSAKHVAKWRIVFFGRYWGWCRPPLSAFLLCSCDCFARRRGTGWLVL